MYDIGQVIEACAEASRQHLCNYRGCLHIYKVKGSIEIQLSLPQPLAHSHLQGRRREKRCNGNHFTLTPFFIFS